MEVQSESEAMIPDSMRRLERAVEELREFVSGSRGELAGSAQLQAAEEVLAAAGASDGALGEEEERI